MPINLLPKKSLDEGPFWQQAFSWSLTIGRTIIIGTELIVLSVFFSRFFLDRQITDLSEETKTKQTIIKTTGQLETRFRKIQDRLAAIKHLKIEQNQYSITLDELSQRIPEATSLVGLDLRGTELVISARTPSGEEFTKLLLQLLSWKDLSQVALTRATFLPKKGGIDLSLALEVRPDSFQWAER